MFDLKVINSVLAEMEEERGIPRDTMLDAIASSLATAYKKEFGKRGQIIRAEFDINTGTTIFNQIKVVLDESMLKEETEEEIEEVPEENHRRHYIEPEEVLVEGEKVRFDAEKHIMIETARLIKKDVEVGEELVFPLEPKDDFGRIAAQTAKQVIIQKIREAEKTSALKEFGQKEGDIVMGHVQRFERGNLYVDLGRVTGVMPYDEQIPGERYRPGERIRCLLLAVEETPRGIFLKLSRSHGEFLENLFAIEAPELQSGAVEVKAVAREAGSRSKIAVFAHDQHIDPVGSMVGQRGVRVSTVMSELGGEKIDIIEWSEDPAEFIEDALSPAQVMEVRIESEANAEENERGHAIVEVAPDQQSLAIGRGGQNVRLAAKLTGWKIDIMSVGGDELAEAAGDKPTNITAPEGTPEATEVEAIENDEGVTSKPDSNPLDNADQATDARDVVSEDRKEDNVVETPENFEGQMAEEEAKSEAEVEAAETETKEEKKA